MTTLSKATSGFINLNRSAAGWLEAHFPRLFGAPSYGDALLSRINADLASRKIETVLEVGGIDRPLLQRSIAFNYVGLDIEQQPRCSEVYDRFFVQSVEEPIAVEADQIISITLLEHVADNDAAIKSMYEALRPGGTTHHYVPSKWHPYSVALRIVGPVLQRRLIPILRPHAAAVTGYPAFFDHCSPTAMRRLFARHGFADIDVRPFWRASDYFAFFLPAYLLVALFENCCAAMRVSMFASGFLISARRPPASHQIADVPH